MNLSQLTRNRLMIIWSGKTSITPKSKTELKYKRRKFRENRKGVFNDKKYINEERD